MDRFVGRERELGRLGHLLDEARSGRGVMVSMRGRRQVGKSRLVGEFVARSGVSTIYFTASRQPNPVELIQFADAARVGGVGGPLAAAGSWQAMLDLTSAGAAPGQPVIVVIDELPYLAETEPAIEAILQKSWRALERRAVLLILIGSDMSVMESLTAHRRPLYGRAREIVVPPLSVAEVAEMRELDPSTALDAYLIIGGFPRLAGLWRTRDTVASFLRRELSDESSPFVVTGERAITAEFAADLSAGSTLAAIGAGERTHGAIASRSGVGRVTVDRTLATLMAKRVVDRTIPYAEPPGSKSPRYAIADPYLRYWHRFVRPAIDVIARGRADLAAAAAIEGWPAYRSRAIEPLVRAWLERLLPVPELGQAQFVGGYWTRDNRVEVDLVGGREPGRAGDVEFVGSVKMARACAVRPGRSTRAGRRSRPGAGRRPGDPVGRGLAIRLHDRRTRSRRRSGDAGRGLGTARWRRVIPARSIRHQAVPLAWAWAARSIRA